MSGSSGLVRCLAAASVVLVLAGCGIPRDPEGTLERIRGGRIRAGISENAPWTALSGGQPDGIEPRLLKELARELDADIEWSQDSEGDLLGALGRRELDVYVGGLTESTPWSDQVALTQPYLAEGGEEHVMAVPQGENRWLLELDRFLQSRKGEALRLLGAEEGR